jgi:hypothetical protein
MDADEEAAARDSYEHAREYAAGPPVWLVGESYPETRDRCGGFPRSPWEVARFDPDPAIRDRALRRILDDLAGRAWREIRGAGELKRPDEQPGDVHPRGPADAFSDLRYWPRSAQGRTPRQFLADLDAKARKVGFRVTETGVQPDKPKRRK